MYLRQTRRTNRDGSVVSYLQLAHNERHPDTPGHRGTGAPTAKVIHNFGRADKVDQDALKRLVSSISRFLTRGRQCLRRRLARWRVLTLGVWVGRGRLDQVWERLGLGAAVRRVAEGRRLDGEAVERVIFALVAQRALEPGSKLAATGWVAERVAVQGLTEYSDDQARQADLLTIRGVRTYVATRREFTLRTPLS